MNEVNGFQTTLTPNPDKFYEYYPVTTQEEPCV